MLENLTIKHFRGISSLSLPNLGRVNILIGKNGAGKTTALEALSVVSALHPTQFIRLAQWRDFDVSTNTSTVEILRSNLYQLDTSFSPQFTFCLAGYEHRLTVNPLTALDIDRITGTLHTLENDHDNFVDYDDGFIGLQNIYTPPNGSSVEIALWASGQTSHQYAPRLVLPRIGCFFIHGRRATSTRETAEAVTRIAESTQDEELLREALSKIEKRIKRVRVGVQGANQTVLIDIGLKRMLPINLLGDGFCRVALMLTGIMGSDSKLVVVDEIDSGLHYSAMGNFWRSSIPLINRFDTQLFCTTHSEEILETAIDAFQDNPEMLRIYRLEQRTEDETHVESFDYSMLRTAELAGFEIR